jgi:Methylase involved in ubiquinone/menaquinone biosynthesis
VLTVVPDPLAVMDEVHRVLAPGGKVFILNRAAAHNAFNRILDPVVSKVLRFSAGFDEVRTFPHDKFTLLERTCCGIFPNVTLFVLEKTQTNPAE